MKTKLLIIACLMLPMFATGYSARHEIMRQADSLQAYITECKNVGAHRTLQGVAIKQECTETTERQTTTIKKTIYIDFTTNTFIRKL